MVQLELTAEEHQVLAQLLTRCASDLQIEIHHTDRGEFRAMLKERLTVVQQLLEKLVPSEAPA